MGYGQGILSPSSLLAITSVWFTFITFVSHLSRLDAIADMMESPSGIVTELINSKLLSGSADGILNAPNPFKATPLTNSKLRSLIVYYPLTLGSP